jgi:hypothetical protein
MPTRHPTDTSKLWIVGVISNPCRYESRYRLFWRWIQHMKDSNVNVMVCELAYGDRPFLLKPLDQSYSWVGVRSFDELWHKENMQNVAMTRLPDDWEYVAFLDCDIWFMSPRWPSEIVESLQHYSVVQPWQTCIDFGPQGEVLKTHSSLTGMWLKGVLPMDSYYKFSHPGYAWAWRREAWEAVGGAIAFGILGAGDHHMALALCGRAEKSLPGGIHPEYRARVLEWQARAEYHVKRDIGVVAGSIGHHFHGKPANRKYVERWEILKNAKYNPQTDIKLDAQGVYQLEVRDERQRGLRDMIRAYFRNRLEDANTIE